MKGQRKAWTYNPCQPGYQRAGRHYIQLDYSGDCKLGRYVSEVFEVSEPGPHPVRILPDGCHDIILTCEENGVRGWLSPSIAHAGEFHFRPARWILGVRFLPGATYALFQKRLPIQEKRGIDLLELCPVAEQYLEPLWQAGSFMKRHEILTDFLTELIRDGDDMEEILHFCMWQLVESKGSLSVEELARRAGYSDRYLRRTFMEHIGHTPKELGSIIRMQSVIRYLLDGTERISLGQVAGQFGFADQSHMNREFRKFLGIPSGRLKEEPEWLTYLSDLSERKF